MAKEHGLVSVLETHKGAGFLEVYDLHDKKEVEVLKNSLSLEDMKSKINKYL